MIFIKANRREGVYLEEAKSCPSGQFAQCQQLLCKLLQKKVITGLTQHWTMYATMLTDWLDVETVVTVALRLWSSPTAF